MQSRIHSSGISSYNTGGAARYTPLGTGTHDTINTVEAYAQLPFRTAGTLSNLHVRALAPGAGASATIKVRKNGADGNEAISIATNASGEFEDTSNTDSITAGDKLCYSIVTNVSNYWVVGLSCLYAASSGMLSKLSVNVENGYSRVATNTSYNTLSGIILPTTTEANVAVPSSVAGTLKNLSVYTDSNSRNAATTFGSRKALGAGNLAISIGASSTGLFEDTSNSDTIAVGDKMCWQSTIASGTGTLVIRFVSTELVTTNNFFQTMVGDSGGFGMNFNGTYEFSISGEMNQFSNWGLITNNVISPTFQKLEVIATGNTINAGTSTVTFFPNNTLSSLAVSIGFGATGIFADTSDTVPVSAGQTMDHKVSTSGASGILTLSAIGMGAQQFPTKTFTADGIILIRQQVRPKLKLWDMSALPEAGSKNFAETITGDRPTLLRELKDNVYHSKLTATNVDIFGDYSGSRTAGLLTESLVDGKIYVTERIKIVSAPTIASHNWAFVLSLFNTHAYANLIFNSDGIQLDYNNVSNIETQASFAMDTTSDYHVYKLELTYTTAKVYVDGVLQISVSVFDNGASHYTLDVFFEENWNANALVEHYIDYIKIFPNNGAQEIDFNSIDLLYGFAIDDSATPSSLSTFSNTGPATREIVSGEYHWKSIAAADDISDDWFIFAWDDYSNYQSFTLEAQLRIISGSTHAGASLTLYYHLYKKKTDVKLLFYTDGVTMRYKDVSNVQQDFFVSLTTSTNHKYKIILSDSDASLYIDDILQTTVNVYTGSSFTPEFYTESNFDQAVTNEWYVNYISLLLTPGFTVDGIIDAPIYHNFTVDGIMLVKGNLKTFTADGIMLHPGNLLTFTVDGDMFNRATKTFTVDGDMFAKNTKTFTADGIIFATNKKTFTVDGDVDVKANKNLFTVDAVIVGFSVTYNRRIGFFLNNALIKAPISMTSEFVFTKTDFTMFTGKSVRDIAGIKKKWVLMFQNLSKDQVDMMRTIVDQKKAVPFNVDSKDALLIDTTVFAQLQNVVYDVVGSDYRASAELDLLEQST